MMLALESAVRISDVSSTDHVLNVAAFAFVPRPRSVLQSFDRFLLESFDFMHFVCLHFVLCFNLEANILEDGNDRACRSSKFLVIGHRGFGMNILQSSDSRFKLMKENSIPSFMAATRFPIDFIEFDVQVREISIVSHVRSLGPRCFVRFLMHVDLLHKFSK